MRLINAKPSPYGRKVAVALREKSIAYEVQYDVPWSAGTCVGEYSPFQQLPILISDDGTVVYDSSYILEWLERRYPEPALLPSGDDAYLAAKLLQTFGERLMEVTSLIVFEVQRADASKPWLARQTRKIGTGFAELAVLVGDRAPTPAEPITLGDIAVVTSLTAFEFMHTQDFLPELPEYGWRKRHPNLARYVDAVESRPSFAATRPQPMDVDLKANVA